MFLKKKVTFFLKPCGPLVGDSHSNAVSRIGLPLCYVFFESINDQGYQVLEERLGIEEGAMEVTPTELSVRNISISVGEKQILKNLYGDIKPGKMTCILGRQVSSF